MTYKVSTKEGKENKKNETKVCWMDKKSGAKMLKVVCVRCSRSIPTKLIDYETCLSDPSAARAEFIRADTINSVMLYAVLWKGELCFWKVSRFDYATRTCRYHFQTFMRTFLSPFNTQKTHLYHQIQFFHLFY